jgi:hypothetical protein
MDLVLSPLSESYGLLLSGILGSKPHRPALDAFLPLSVVTIFRDQLSGHVSLLLCR